MSSLIKWMKIIFYMFFYYITQKDIKVATKMFSKKVIEICKTQIISNKLDFDLKNFVIMATHKSYFDIFCIEYCFSGIKIIWFAKKELFKIPIFGHILKKTGAVCVDRGSVLHSALMIRRFFKDKKNDVAFAIFPYGTRKHTKAFKSGGIYFAKKLKLPIIPVKIEGSENVMPPGKITIQENQKVNIKIYDKINPDLEVDKIESTLKKLI
ncbi:MAG: lysophospholipid acyltransferase family protein [Desulfurella sp.]|uniref:lysophospholipid acyltransferase family protein n=2 Tax=Desulfurella sp. TaxID=1962857 RepID=UPI003D130EAF